MTIENYINNLNQRYTLGNATEHTFRGDLQQLLETLLPEIRATNEPKRQKCGAPDYILTKKEIPIGFIEAKDIGDKDLEGKKKTGNKEQFDRYKASLSNLIFTDYIDFHIYQDGELITKIAIAEILPSSGGVSAGRGGKIVPIPENFTTFTNLIKNFATHIGQTIKSSKRLAEMMAGKARLLSDVIEKALNSDVENLENSTLKEQMLAFKDILIHDITPKGFADVYAQTIAYGMFAARLHDPTLETFSRQEAAELIPKSNPFLRKLFGYIAGPDIDDRIKWIVENLTEIFLACNVEEILKNYGKSTKMEDPIIHFYETFLAEYDPKLRKARGVWYTPAPVVNFIVRAVDDILKTEFNLPQGLADSSKTTIKVKTDIVNKNFKSGYQEANKEVHKVQILDPATGTGTFLAEVIKHVHKKFKGQEGIWSSYAENHLLPRLNGFELLMASYAMAHLQIDLLLKETGFKPTKNQRTKIYLTNSLEEYHPDTGTLFANWLSSEANEANHIKRDTPVMCVIGNPPYSINSSNKGEWIENLLKDYKKDLNEKSYNSLSDDYVKFIRYGQHYIEKNGTGILAYISNNSFVDGITHRQMRKHLLETFDTIYILDLHGNSKKKEVCSDGTPDQNVFDIMQGVSINIFVKTGNKFPSNGGVPNGRGGALAKVFHYDLYGKRDFKYDFLNENTLSSISWCNLVNQAPNFFFANKDYEGLESYESGFKINSLFDTYGPGVETGLDRLFVSDDQKQLLSTFQELSKKDDEVFDSFGIENKKSFKVKDKLIDDDFTNIEQKLVKYQYKIFDFKTIAYLPNSLRRADYKVFKNCNPNNFFLTLMRSSVDTIDFKSILISKEIIDKNLYSFQTYALPLYLYPETNGQQTIEQTEERTPNLNLKIVDAIAKKLGLTFVPEKSSPPFPSLGGVPERRGGKIETKNCGKIEIETKNSGKTQENNTLKNEDKKASRNTQNYMNLPYNPKLKQRARELRQAGNLSEVLFWNEVKNKQFKGFDFDRQKIIGNYIVDFYCTNCNVVIEIDGSSHDNKVDYDAERDAFLESLGVTVIHIAVSDVFNNITQLINMLHNHPALQIVQPIEDLTTPPVGHPSNRGEFAPIDILDYIYAVLHSPTYREKYKEFLKIDFPRVPYPKDQTTFWQLVTLGGELRQIHLLESETVENYITSYPEAGDNIITRSLTKTNIGYQPITSTLGKVWINDTQYFNNVPLVAWEFYIGGYQPAQKWLKDRKDRELSFEDILHYQKIIVALTETHRIMQELDGIAIE